MTQTQIPSAEQPVTYTFNSDRFRSQSTRARTPRVKENDGSQKSICVVYQPQNEPIYQGYSGVLQSAEGAQSLPVRPMNVEYWEKLPTPRVDDESGNTPPTQYSPRYYSLDLWPGATFNIRFDIWEKMVDQLPHLKQGMEAGFIRVITPMAKHKGSANCSAAFNTNEAIFVIQNTWDADMLERWNAQETRDSVKEAIGYQVRRVREQGNTRPMDMAK